MTSSKKPLSVRVDADLLAEMKNLCRDYSGRPHYLAFAVEVERALRERLAALKQQVGEQPDPLAGRNHTTRSRQT